MAKRKDKVLEGLPPAARAIEAGRRFRPVAFEFRDECGTLTFAKGVEGDTGRFRMVAYTGKPMQHWLWGNVIVDLAGLKLPAQKMPALRQHTSDRIVGFSQKITKDGALVVEGVFSGVTEDGLEVGKLLEEGFPWQASIGIGEGVTEFVKEGQEVEVNGAKLRGPGTVFRKSVLNEVSFVTLGADRRTSVEALAAGSDPDPETILAAFTFEKESEMSNEPKTEPPAPAPTPTPAPPAPPAPAVTAAAAPPAGTQTVTLSAQEIEALVDRKVRVLADTRRTREAKLRPLAFANQEQLLQDLVAGDKPIEDCALELVKDFKEKGGAKLAALQKDPAAGVGAGSGKVESNLSASEESLISGGVVDEKKAKENFAASRELQHEFGSESGYLAYLKATASGSHRFRIVEGQRSAAG